MVSSCSTTTVIIFEQQRFVRHCTDLAAFSQGASTGPSIMATQLLDKAGCASVEANQAVMEQNGDAVFRVATFLSSMDGFHVLIAIALCGAVFALLQRQIR